MQYNKVKFTGEVLRSINTCSIALVQESSKCELSSTLHGVTEQGFGKGELVKDEDAVVSASEYEASRLHPS